MSPNKVIGFSEGVCVNLDCEKMTEKLYLCIELEHSIALMLSTPMPSHKLPLKYSYNLLEACMTQQNFHLELCTSYYSTRVSVFTMGIDPESRPCFHVFVCSLPPSMVTTSLHYEHSILSVCEICSTRGATPGNECFRIDFWTQKHLKIKFRKSLCDKIGKKEP